MHHILPHEAALRGWLARRRAPAAFDVDDIVQESYALLAERERVDDILNPRAYLFQVAHSLVVRSIRRARIVPIVAVEDLGLLDLPDDSATPEQNVIAHDDLRELAEVIASMPGQTREAFVLRRVRGLSQREIASHMGLSENTVEKHIVRGLRWLADWFASGGKPPGQRSNKMKREPRRAGARARNQPGY
nr:sigma-70 family RNA polymerase sigma factor [uncultured Steroidobacter sp.]